MRRTILRQVLGIALLGLLPFVPAGTLAWPQG